jgi:prophage DNA circulation protein
MITDNFVTSIQALTETLRTAINDPADQIALLIDLASYQAPATHGASPIQTAIGTVSASMAALCRRAVLTSLARACAAYQPTSSNETIALLTDVVPLFEAEVLFAGDVGDLETFASMRQLRSSVVTDLQTRGANLPEVLTITTNESLPNLVLAYQLYGDANRAEELVQRNQSAVICSAFLPTTLEVLSR